MSFKDKTILLTGAAGGIGSEIAKQLAQNGARLVLVDRDPGQLQVLGEALNISSHGGEVIAADLTAKADRDRLLKQLSKSQPCLDVLINCAGINSFAMFTDMDETIIEKMITVNITAPMVLTRQLLPLLKRSKHAQIINFGSIFGSIGYPGYVTYSATKFAMRGFSESLRRELAKSNITVSYIAPRATKTAINTGPVYEMNKALGVKMDEPSLVASRVLALVKSGRSSDKYLGWPERLFVKINNLFPTLVDNSLLKQLDTIRHFAGYSRSP